MLGSFPCLQCPTKLARKSDLNQHMNSHTDKFKCNICGKRNSRSSSLLEHIAKKHQGLPNIPLRTGPTQNSDASPPLAHPGGKNAPAQGVVRGPPVTQQHPLSLFERLEKVRREERDLTGCKYNYKYKTNTNTNTSTKQIQVHNK